MRYPRLIALIFLGFVLRAQNPFYTTFNKTRDLAPGEQDQAITAFDIKDKILCLSSYYSWAYNSWGMVSSVWDSSGTFLSKTTFIDSTYFSLSVLKPFRLITGLCTVPAIFSSGRIPSITLTCIL